VQGTASGEDELWALIEGGFPLYVELAYKIIWRFTGPGDLHIDATGPDGSAAEMLFGPDYHGTGSSWRRPGFEYGTGYKFHTVGCWQFHPTTRPTATTSRTGDLWVMVNASG
jgi:hypothetical protein